jgi:hypothetical protein
MRQLTDGAPTRDRQEPLPKPSKLWTVLEALGYAGAFIDPTGVLAAQRFRRASDQEQRHAGR